MPTIMYDTGAIFSGKGAEERARAYDKQLLRQQWADGRPHACRIMRARFNAEMAGLKGRTDKLGAEIEAFTLKRSGKPVLGL